MKPATLEVWQQPCRNLITFFGDGKSLKSITPGDAEQFKQWIVTEPLAVATIAKRLSFCRTFLHVARKRRGSVAVAGSIGAMAALAVERVVLPRALRIGDAAGGPVHGRVVRRHGRHRRHGEPAGDDQRLDCPPHFPARASGRRARLACALAEAWRARIAATSAGVNGRTDGLAPAISLAT